MFSFLNNESKTIVGAAAIVGVLSFASRVVGLIRDRILLGEFGAGDVLDAYYAAFKLPDLLFGLLVIGSLSASFIPIFTKYFFAAFKRERAWQFTSNVLNLLALSMAALSVILFLFAGPLSTLIAPGFDPPKQGMVADMTRVMLLAQFILALSVVFGSALQGMKRFLIFSLAPILYNVGIIIGAVWLTDIIGTIGLAWGVVLGALLHFLLQLYGVLQAGYRWQLLLHWRDEDTQEMLRLTGPRMLGIAVSQINFVILTVIATTLAAGSVTIFQVAYNIQFFAVGTIGISYAIAVFPTLVEAAGQHDRDRFISTFEHTVRQVLFFMIPLSLVFLVLRAQIVRVVAGAGAFDWTATILAADTLAFFTFSFAAQALVFVLARAFFAYRDTATPLVAGLVAGLFSLIAALWFSQHFGVVGLAIAYSLGAIVNVVLLWMPLRQRMGTLHEYSILRSLYVIAVAGLGCVVTMQALKPLVVKVIAIDTFLGVLAQGVIAGGAGLLVYALICYGLKSPELAEFASGLRRRIVRKAQPEETIPTSTMTS
jgi:putative peptidoglycan lipid II flippase